MKSYLDKYDKRVEADDDYKGEDAVKSVGSVLHNLDEKVKGIRQRVQSRQETVNRRRKQFSVLHHHATFHGDCYYAIAVLTQLMLVNDHPLFQVPENNNGALAVNNNNNNNNN